MSFQKYSFFHSLRIVASLGWADFSLKYRGSLLGYAWSLVGPLGKFLVIYTVFGPYVQNGIPLYAQYLFIGIIIWEHFVTTTVGCIYMPTEKEAIIRRIVFPRILLILSVGYTNFLIFGTHMIIFLIGSMLFTDVSLSMSSFYMIGIALQMTFLALGVGMGLGAFSLKFKDIPHLWNVIVQMLFWLCPVVYQITGSTPTSMYVANLFSSSRPGSLGDILRIIAELQPLSIIMRDARNVILYGHTIGIPTLTHIASATLITGAIFLVGSQIFIRRSRYFLQEY